MAGRPADRQPPLRHAGPPAARLREHDLTATFFVEAINAEMYPDALRDIAAAGHELGLHGWSHEPWAQLDAGREAELLERSLAALAELGIRPTGFRPPGGELAACSDANLRAAGIQWVSPADEPLPVTTLPTVAFRWADVDAYHLLPRFESLRAAHGDPRLPPEALGDRLVAAVDEAIAQGERRTLVLHPFLAEHPAVDAAHERLLAHLRARPGATRPRST